MSWAVAVAPPRVQQAVSEHNPEAAARSAGRSWRDAAAAANGRDEDQPW